MGRGSGGGQDTTYGEVKTKMNFLRTQMQNRTHYIMVCADVLKEH